MSFFGMYECIMQLLEYLVKSHMQIADKPYKKRGVPYVKHDVQNPSM